jgi:hypothetical protein
MLELRRWVSITRGSVRNLEGKFASASGLMTKADERLSCLVVHRFSVPPNVNC